MDIMDIQAVESKLSDVTVTPIPRSQVQNFYNYQQREQREQQPQIQISAIRNNSHNNHGNQSINDHPAHSRSGVGRNDLYSKPERDYHGSSSSVSAALQYTQHLQAQLALLQQHSNTTASPAGPRSSNTSSSSNGISGLTNALNAAVAAAVASQSQLKYPQSTSPLMASHSSAAAASSSSLASLANTHNLVSSVNMATSGNGAAAGSSSNSSSSSTNGLSKYAQLLAVIEELGRDIRPTYTGSRCSTERLKRSLVHARILVRECLMETERSARP